jgi:hypothetical protein
MREDGLAEHEVTAVVEAVRSRIDGGSGGGGGSTGSSFRAWLTGGMLLAAASGGVLLWGRSNMDTSNHQEERSPAIPPEVSPSVSPTEERTDTEPQELAETPSDVHENTSATPPQRTTRPTKRSRIQEPEASNPAPEHVLLSEARQALPGDPSRALSLSESHRQHYPNGLLAPEREMIAIDALLALGRESEARARAAGVLRRWPGSSHAARITARHLVQSGEEE